MSIKEHAGRVLHAMAEWGQSADDERRGRYNLKGEGVRLAVKELQDCDLTPEQINDVVEILERSGYVDVRRALGTQPYSFMGVELTSRGRLEYENSMERRSKPQGSEQAHRGAAGVGRRIFIGHGRSPAWRVLKDFIQERLKLEWDEFNREATAGLSTKERLQAMLDQATFAFLIMTAEDERADGTKVARANVVHEVGLFQGRLGFARAIVLLEEGCEEFSNIVGITQIRFPKGQVEAVFEEVRRVLERENVLETTS